MQRLLRGLIALSLCGLALVVLIWAAWDPIIEAARQQTETLLAKALHLPVGIGRVRVTLRRARIDIGDATVGDNGAAMRVRDGRLTLDVIESIRRRQPVGDLVATDVEIAPLSFSVPNGTAAPAVAERPLPLFVVRRVHVVHATLSVPSSHGTLTITAEHLGGRVAATTGNRLEASIRARALHVSQEGRDLPLTIARARIAYAPGRLTVPAGIVIGPEVEVRVRRNRVDTGHLLDASIDLAALARVEPQLDRLRGKIEIDGSITDPVESLHVDAHVTAPQLDAYGQMIDGIDAVLRLRGPELELVTLSARHLSGAYEASGTVGLHDAIAFSVDGEWRYRQDDRENAEHHAAPLVATAQITAHGTVTPLAVVADVNGATERAAGGGARVEIHGHATYEDRTARAQLQAKQVTGNAVSLDVSMDPAGNLAGGARARVTDVVSWQGLLGTPTTPEVNGVLDIDAQLGGTRDHPRVDAHASGANLNAFGTTLASVAADLHAERERLDLARLTLRFPRGAITADGTFGLTSGVTNDWRIAITDLPTQDAAGMVAAATGITIPLWSGILKASATGGGPWDGITVHGDLHAENFYLGREPIADVGVTFRSARSNWSADARLEHGPEEWLAATVSGEGRASIAASLRSSTWNLRRVESAMRLGLTGQVTVEGNVQGPPTGLNGHVHLGGDAVEWAQRAVGQVVFDADAHNGSWQLQARFGDQISASGTFDARGDLPLRANVQWHDADLAPFIRPDPNVRIDSSGALNVQIPLRAVERIDGGLTVDRFDVAAGNQGGLLLSLPTPIEIVARAGRVDLRSVHLAGTGTDITATGWLTTTGQVEVDVNATSNLALLEALSAAVEAARGTATVHARVRKSGAAAPQLSGSATLERVAVDFGPPWVIVNVNGGLSFGDSTIHVDTLTGRLEGGTFSLGGQIDLARGPALTWTATDIAPTVISDLEAELSGHGGVHGSWSEIVADGEIEVTRAVYSRRFAVTDLIPLFHEKLEKPKAKEPSATVVRLDLHVVAPDELFIDNNIAKIEMRSDLHLSGPAQEVAIAGPVEVLEGEVKFRGRTFTLTSGLIEFRPELGRQAYLNINAQTIIPGAHANYTIETHIVGTTADYRVTFSSDDPNLSQTDLVSLITFGKTVAELQEGGGGVSISDLVALAPGLYQEQAQEQAQTLLGVDKVELEPGYSKSTGLYEPRVTLGKNLTQDLSASLSSTFGIQRRQRMQLEYHVSPRISLLGDWESASTDQAGAFGGEIKFRYPFRSFPGWTALLPWPGDDVQ